MAQPISAALRAGAALPVVVHALPAGDLEKLPAWLKRHGVAEERLILEPRSLLTPDNAVYLSAILTEQYPQIRSLVIVSSS